MPGPTSAVCAARRLGAEPGTRIPGIMTPDEHTIVFDLERQGGSNRCAGGILAAALSMPLSAPVPREYARRFDAKPPSTYGAHQVATGPYMVENDASGSAVGYEPGRRIRLVRNPNWSAPLDNRPAYLDEIEIRQGNDDATLMSRRILEGESMINGDQPPPPAVLRRALAERRDQIRLVPSRGHSLDRDEHHDPAVRRCQRPPRRDRRLRPRGDASDLRRQGERGHPDALPSARNGGLRRGRRPGRPGLRFHVTTAGRHEPRGRVPPQSGVFVRQIRRRQDAPDGGREHRGRRKRG